jgi:hypothetical protein
MRFDARHIGSGVWDVWDGGVMGWRGSNLAENEAKQRAADIMSTSTATVTQTSAARYSHRSPSRPPPGAGR